MKLGKIFFSLLLVLFLTSFVFAQGNSQENFQGEGITIHYFYMRGCPDCERQKDFLENVIIIEYPEVEIIEYNIRETKNQEKFHEMMAEREIENYRLNVPTTFIENNTFQGFHEGGEFYDYDDKELMKRAIEGEYVQDEIYEVRGKHLVQIPFIGKVDLGTWALPIVALVIGSLDGLNVCAIGALILILMIVLGFESRKKIILYGGMFILTTVVVYGLLVFAWTALFNALASYISVMNIIIGLAAFGGGLYFGKKFIQFYKYGPACDYTDNKFIINATNRLKTAFKSEKRQTTFLITSVMVFAVIVTLVELPCSFGLPMIYGSILANAGLSWGGYVSYILLYLFFYSLILLIIFTGAVITKEVWFAESKFITWVYLAGTLVLFFLSYYYLFVV